MKKKKLIGKIIKTVIMALVAILFLSPFLWMLSSSLKLPIEVESNEFHFFGEKLQWGNYVEVFTGRKVSMLSAYRNTLFVAVISITLRLAFSSMAAYAFAKMRFKGKNALFMLFLASMMIPGQATLIPRFMLFKTVGLYNTLWALILPSLFGASGIFLLRQYYMGLPTALMEAAKIDGAGHFRIFTTIYLPLSKPALISLTLLNFVDVWNEYLSAMVFITKSDLYIISQVIKSFAGDMGDPAVQMAAASCAVFPIFILFLFCQKYFIEGISTSGVKG